MSSSLPPDKMSPIELRATAGLAGIYGLRMLGMFIILPVFAFYAEHLPGGVSYTLVGIALGAYCRSRLAGCPIASAASPSFTSD